MNQQVFKSVSELDELIDSFRDAIEGDPCLHPKGICGFDGFIDSFIKMRSPSTMTEFGSHVALAAGISMSCSVEHQADKFGGNGPLLASALNDIFSGKIDLCYIGSMGEEEVLPIYQAALAEKTTGLYTLGEPAHSDCLEFSDGKIMLSDLRQCEAITWERLLQRVGEEQLDRLLRETDFIGAVNWGKLIHAGTIWRNLARRLGQLGREAKSVVCFMDLAEFEQRPRQDREALLEIIGEVTAQCQSILSLNLKEAWQMGETIGCDFVGKKAPEDVLKLAQTLRERIAVDRIVIHPNDGAAIAGSEQSIYLPGPFCSDPLISIGAGDNFGAGVLAATLRGLGDPGVLLAGVAASGHFVRSGRSASWADMNALLDNWRRGDLAERL